MNERLLAAEPLTFYRPAILERRGLRVPAHIATALEIASGSTQDVQNFRPWVAAIPRKLQPS